MAPSKCSSKTEKIGIMNLNLSKEQLIEQKTSLSHLNIDQALRLGLKKAQAGQID